MWGCRGKASSKQAASIVGRGRLPDTQLGAAPRGMHRSSSSRLSNWRALCTRLMLCCWPLAAASGLFSLLRQRPQPKCQQWLRLAPHLPPDAYRRARRRHHSHLHRNPIDCSPSQHRPPPRPAPPCPPPSRPVALSVWGFRHCVDSDLPRSRSCPQAPAQTPRAPCFTPEPTTTTAARLSHLPSPTPPSTPPPLSRHRPAVSTIPSLEQHAASAPRTSDRPRPPLTTLRRHAAATSCHRQAPWASA